jgi:hypothetical protein
MFGAYRRLLCNLNAIGASGWMMVSHAFLTFTSRIAFRLTFLVVDFEPRVATSLRRSVMHNAIVANPTHVRMERKLYVPNSGDTIPLTGKDYYPI